MNDASLRHALEIVAILVVAGVIAWAGSHGSVSAFGMPLFALCALLSFAVNWVAFVPAYAFQTEHYYDLSGSLTYLALVSCAVGFAGAPDGRGILLAILIGVWAVRLGSFLFIRVKQDGSDGRFDEIKPDFLWFLMAWTLQGLWVFLTASCALAAITSSERVTLGWVGAVGAVVWLVGFGIEVVADAQKRRFRADPARQGQFITSGLWAWSRHPNYFGEILLWAGIAILALPALSGWQLVTLISPLFVYVLLTRISGVPMLESRGKRKWGEDPEYRAYKARTPVLIPRPPAARRAS